MTVVGNKIIILLIASMILSVNMAISQVSKNRGTFVQKDGPIQLGGTSDGRRLLFRWAPSEKKVLDDIQKYGIQVTKIWNQDNRQNVNRDTLGFDIENITNSSKPTDSLVIKAVSMYKYIQNQPTIQDPIEAFAAQENVFFSKLLIAGISIEAASYQLLGYIDEDVTKGIDYYYTFDFLAPDLKADRYKLQIRVDDTYDFPVIEGWSGNGLDRAVELSWNIDGEAEEYLAFYVEKSKDGRSFYRLSDDIPYLHGQGLTAEKSTTTTIRDSLAENSVPVYYRLQGINFFGQLGPYTSTIEITGIPAPIPSRPSITGVQEINLAAMDVGWHFNPDFERQIEGFYIERSTALEGPYTIISRELPADKRSFLDESPLEIQFYRIVAIDKNGNRIISPASLVQRNDVDAPERPEGLEGSIDSNGIVYLSWIPNTESDLDGYNVFYSNVRNGEYSILTNKSDIDETYFVDTIATNTLAQKIYYKILAIDFRGNQSLFSEPLELQRPDKYPPVPAVFKKKRNLKDEIYLVWANSSSSDLATNELQKSTDLRTWETIHRNQQSRGLTEYTDKDVDCKTSLFYRILSTDHSGLSSISEVVEMQCIASGQLPEITNLKLEQQEQSIILSWSQEYELAPNSILIFRSEDGAEPRKIKQLWPADIPQNSTYQFEDTAVRSKKTYQYYVVMRYPDRHFSKSPLTKKIKMRKSRK